MGKTINADAETLFKLLVEPARYIIPLFQRGYRWGPNEWGVLWEDLVNIASAPQGENHFMGFLVMEDEAAPGSIPCYYLVDGQQRLSTSSILLAAIRNVARENGHQDLSQDIDGQYLVHSRKSGDVRYRLLPKDRDRSDYKALIDGGNQKPQGAMADALNFFMGEIQAHTGGDAKKLEDFCNAVVHRLQFVSAVLPESQNAYEVFKGLNSKSVGLGESDLIRNLMFMNAPQNTHEEFDRDGWKPLEDAFAKQPGAALDRKEEKLFSQFFRHFLMVDSYVGRSDAAVDFEKKFAKRCKTELWDVAEELKEAVRYYTIIRSREGDENGTVAQSLKGLNELDSSTTYPLLLALFARRAKGGITDEQLAKCIEMLRGFIFRRYICKYNGRGYGRRFSGANDLLAGNEDPVAALRDFLIDYGWPSNEKFQLAFEQFPFYENGYAKEMLAGIERAQKHREPADMARSQVEHVMPQTLTDQWREMLGTDAESIHDKWLHMPGNLTLTGYNQQLHNDTFEAKCNIYEKSHYVITAEIPQKFTNWGEEQIRQRGRQLAEDAARVWIGEKG